MSITPEGLVVVFLENGTAFSEDTFNDWYENEHAPLRFTLDGYLAGARYKATDSQIPTWGMLYDISSINVANSPAYLALHANASEKDKTLLASAQYFSRRVYKKIRVYHHPEGELDAPTKFLLFVGLEVTAEMEDEFNKWYHEEHMALVMKVPGWRKGTRYFLDSEVGRGDGAGKLVCRYLAVHEFDNDKYMSTPEFKEATSTPWREEVMKGITRKEMRTFELVKVFKKP